MLLPYIGIAIGSILPAVFCPGYQRQRLVCGGGYRLVSSGTISGGKFYNPEYRRGKVSINPLMALVSLLLGGMLFGLAGLILALPMAAVLKVFDAVPSLKPYGFLIGEPENYHLKRYSGKIILKRWKLKENKEARENGKK